VTDPLFVADLATLKQLLRLTGVPASAADTLAILDEAILKSRLYFLRRLGADRVAALVAMTFEENPLTADDAVRALANTVEVKLVYSELLRRLPAAFMDASGDLNRRWNEEAPFRERSSFDAKAEILRLHDEVEEDMQILAGEEAVGEESDIRTFDGTPTFTPPRPGDSLRGPSTCRLNED